MVDIKEAIKFNKDKNYEVKLYYLFSKSWLEMGKPFKGMMWLDHIKDHKKTYSQ